MQGLLLLIDFMYVWETLIAIKHFKLFLAKLTFANKTRAFHVQDVKPYKLESQRNSGRSTSDVDIQSPLVNYKIQNQVFLS